MTTETTVAAPGTVTTPPDRIEVAADLLARLTPDDLHPARLTGPHAWHPWGLTTRKPTDHQVRLVTSTGLASDAPERLLDHLQIQLQRPSWPPRPQLHVHRHGSRLDCEDSDGHHAVLHLEQHDALRTAVGRDVVTRDGWPIVAEVAALSDRLAHIQPNRPALGDIDDLSRWVEHKMTTPGIANLTCPLPLLLRTQAALHPDAATRLASILEQATPRVEARGAGPLQYLRDQQFRAQGVAASVGAASARTQQLQADPLKWSRVD